MSNMNFTYESTPEFEELLKQLPLRPTYARKSDAPDSARDMTAADLGLYDIAEARAWVHRQMLATNAVYRRMVLGDAPYSFWLGADHG